MAVDVGVQPVCGFRRIDWSGSFWGAYSQFRVEDESGRYGAVVSGSHYNVIIGPFIGTTSQNRVWVEAIDENGNVVNQQRSPVFAGSDPIYAPPPLGSFGLDSDPPGSSPSPGSEPASESGGPAPWTNNPTGSRVRIRGTIDQGTNGYATPTQYRQVVNGTPGEWKDIYYSGEYEPQDFVYDVTGLTPGVSNTVRIDLRNDIGTSESPELTVTTEPQYWISGKVQDDSGAPVFNTPVEIENEEGETVVVYTDENGEFEVETPDGTYEIAQPALTVIGIEDVR